MEFRKLTTDLNIISSLPDQPTITASELKAKFDEAGNIIKDYINADDGLVGQLNTFQTEIENTVETKISTLTEDIYNTLAETKAEIEGQMTELETSVNNKISEFETVANSKIEYGDFVIEATSTFSINNGNGSLGNHSTTISKTGYFPLGVVGYKSTSTNHYNNTNNGACMMNIYLTNQQAGKCTINAQTYVADNNAWTYSSTYSAYILWVKVK